MSDAEKRETINGMYEGYKQSFANTPDLSVSELVALRVAEEVVVVDVREREEFAVSHIPGAVFIDDFEAHREKHRDKKVVAYCTIGARSGEYAQKLQEKDGVEAYNLKGSILSWVQEGEPVVDSEGNETRRVHVYGRKWDLIPEGYESVW
jgi:sodium/bile acid cotransporter 7